MSEQSATYGVPATERLVLRVEVAKAARADVSDPVADLEIVAVETTPPFATLEAQRAEHVLQARAIVGAMAVTLPGGLVDQILVALLEGRASHFRVPWIP